MSSANRAIFGGLVGALATVVLLVLIATHAEFLWHWWSAPWGWKHWAVAMIVVEHSGWSVYDKHKHALSL